MHHQPSLFVLKSAPGEFLSSAAKWALSLTRTIELLNLTVCTTVQAWRVVAAWANFEAPNRRTVQGSNGHGCPFEAIQDTMSCIAGLAKTGRM
jgi:hypothetical protein